MSRRIDGDGGESDAEGDSGWELVLRDFDRLEDD